MAACPRSSTCAFHITVEPSIVKRVRYASVFPYCKGGRHEECAIFTKMLSGAPVPRNLMPDGLIGDYMDDEVSTAKRFLIIEDSPVFAALASSTIASHFRGAEIDRRPSYEAAVEDLSRNHYSAIVCGYGLGGDRTAHDVRRVSAAPMVVLTGRPGDVHAPMGAVVVQKGQGSEALASALRSCVA